MIIVDESIDSNRIIQAIAAWYSGHVQSVRHLRTGTLVKDDAIPMLLTQVTQPTFVTINVDDFGCKTPANNRYCILAIEWEQHRALELPALLRQILRLSEFRTKAAHMGKVVRVRPAMIEYYGSDRQIQVLAWSG